MSAYDPGNRVTYFAESDFRNRRIKFGIKRLDRARHMYVIGKTGMGKSTMLENLAIQDIQNGEGLCFIDPHGGTAEKLLDYVPQDRVEDVLYFAPFDTEYPVAFNVMEDVGADRRHLVANGLMSAFKKIWVDAWSARMEYILNNTLLALLEYPDSTLLGVNRMLADKDYRSRVVANISDPSVKNFWVDEFAKYGDRYMQEAGAAIQNKVGQFVSNPLVRNLIGQPKSTFDIRRMMDERKILIMNMSKGQVGEQNANLIGSMLITKVYLAAMSRANLREEELRSQSPFYLFVDEFQSFANDSFADILSEARKYKLNLIVAHQYIEQMTEMVRAAVFGNVGTTVAFRVGPFDAEVLEKIFEPTFTAEHLVNLGFAQIYTTLMIDGVGSPPFSAQTMAPIPRPPASFKSEIIANSRKVFACPRAEVEDFIHKWYLPIEPLAKIGGAPSFLRGESARRLTAPQSGGKDGGGFARPQKEKETRGERGASSGSALNIGSNRDAPRSSPPRVRGEGIGERRRIPLTVAAKPMPLSSLKREVGGGSLGGSLGALRDTIKRAMEKAEPISPPPMIEIPAGNESFGEAHTEEEREIPPAISIVHGESTEPDIPKEIPRDAEENERKKSAPIVPPQPPASGVVTGEEIERLVKVSDEELKDWEIGKSH